MAGAGMMAWLVWALMAHRTVAVIVSTSPVLAVGFAAGF
jgi:hypothetical protein